MYDYAAYMKLSYVSMLLEWTPRKAPPRTEEEPNAKRFRRQALLPGLALYRLLT